MIRARLSPITVERRWPTCIGLATFGDEKSMTTDLTRAGSPSPSRSSVSNSRKAEETQASFKRRLRNPGPATSGGPAIGVRSTRTATCCANSRGLRPSDLANAMQPLA